MEKQPVAFSSTVLIIGAGPAGLAAAACLTSKRISVLILDREDTIASLWRYRTYDRLHLHLKKQYCELPIPFPPSTAVFPSCADFLRYLDNYAETFRLKNLLRLRRRVDSAQFDRAASGWRVDAVNLETGAVESDGRENDAPVLPVGVNGLDRFSGETVHAHQFRTGKAYKGLDVLVVGSGNSGMEIACDLAESGARASIVARGQIV
ncbi:Indole-3-pyruvate monooxygenase YUCCA6 [Platanthera zijinensis]|uniref:Flavin-containing monooxygenase n=1 Tax=Platanthera zijinensis TaxID=2320716 RepID=A0AAP0FZR0_9ASPA